MDVVPQQTGRSALAQLPVEVNEVRQTHSPAGVAAGLTAQPPEKTLAATFALQPIQAGSQPFGNSSGSQVPGFRIPRTAASASKQEPRSSPGSSTRWKRFKTREAPSKAAQQQVHSGQDGGPAALVNSQAGVKRATCPIADAGSLAAIQQPATGPGFELDLDLGLTTPADPCTNLAPAERGGIQGNGSTLRCKSRQPASNGICLESAAQHAAAPRADSEPASQPVAVACIARPEDTGRHSQRNGGRAEQFPGKDACGAQAHESDFSLELDLGGSGATVGPDAPANCSGAADIVLPARQELGDLKSRMEDAIVGGDGSMEPPRQWVLPFQALRPKQPLGASRAAQTAALSQVKDIGQPTTGSSCCFEGGDEAPGTAQQTSAAGLLKGKAGSDTCQAAAMGRSGCEPQQLSVPTPAWQPTRNTAWPKQAGPQRETWGSLQTSDCLQQNGGSRRVSDAATPAESDSREPQVTAALQPSGPVGTADSEAAETLSSTPVPGQGPATTAATATKKLPGMSSIRRRLASSRLKQPLKRAYGDAAAGLEEDLPSLQAQAGLEDQCDGVKQGALPSVARPLKRLKRAVDSAAARSPEPPTKEAVPKGNRISRLMPVSLEAEAAAAPGEAEKASNPFVSQKSVQKNLQAKLSVLNRKPKPKPATLPEGRLGPMMQSVLAGQRQSTSTGTHQSWLSLVHTQPAVSGIIDKALLSQPLATTKQIPASTNLGRIATTKGLTSSSGPDVGGADTPIDLTGDEPSPVTPSECQHTTGPVPTAAASADHRAGGNPQKEARPPVGIASSSGDGIGGSSAAANSAPSALPWWYRLPDFVPLAALADGVNPRTGAVVYIDYKAQFQEATDSPAKARGGATKKATARKASAAGRRPGAAKKARGSGHTARKSFWAKRGRFGRR